MRSSAVTCIVRLGPKDTRLQLYRRHPQPDARRPCRGTAPGGPGPTNCRPIPPACSHPPTNIAACATGSAHTAAQCAATAAPSDTPTAGGSIATQCAPAHANGNATRYATAGGPAPPTTPRQLRHPLLQHGASCNPRQPHRVP